MNRKHTAVTAALLTAVLFTANVAHAKEATFTYRRTELQTPAGLRKVLNRLEASARIVCRGEVPVITKAEKACRRDVTAQWVLRINHPGLTHLAPTDTRNFPATTIEG